MTIILRTLQIGNSFKMKCTKVTTETEYIGRSERAELLPIHVLVKRLVVQNVPSFLITKVES